MVLPVSNGAGELALHPLQVQADAGRDGWAWLLLNVTCDGRLPKRKSPSSSPHLPSTADARRNGQSPAHTMEEFAYSLAQICSLNCIRAAPVFSTPPLCLTFLSFPSLLSSAPSSVCFSVILAHFTPLPFQSFGLHQAAIVWAQGEKRENWRGPGLYLARRAVGTRLSASNDALIISTLEPARHSVYFCGFPFALSISLYLPLNRQLLFASWWFWFPLRSSLFPSIPGFPSIVCHFHLLYRSLQHCISISPGMPPRS